MIELLQNISYHACGKSDESIEKPGLMMVSDHNKVYSLITCNYIDNDKKQLFEEYVNYVNSLDRQELVKTYLERLLAKDNEDQKAVKLGLIDIRRKTKNDIETAIFPHNDKKSIVVIKATINY